VTAADALEVNHMYLAELGSQTRSALGALLPAAASLQNPVDMLASASPEQYARGLEILLDDPNVHAVLVILPPPPMFAAGAVAKALIPVIHQATKPVVIALMGERLIQEAVEHFRAARVPEYRFPERAASALAVLAQRAAYLSRATATPHTFADVDREAAYSLLGPFFVTGSKNGALDIFLPQQVVNALMQAYNISIPPIKMARSAQEAAEMASSIGYPVALKLASDQIIHKSDVGGVALNLADAEAVSQGYTRLVENARVAHPDAINLGVHVQRMISGGQEVIIGAVQDPQFGPLVMFGSGGVEVEGVKDVAFALAPMTDEEAEYLLESTWAGRRLAGYRYLSPADREATKDVLLRLAQLAADFPQLAEIEINPLRVLHRGQGAFAVDVRARLS
jgi:acetyltransferase